jgi:hypothetical protein
MLKRLREIVGKVLPGATRAPAPAPAADKAKPKAAANAPKEPPIPKLSVDPRRFAGRRGAGAWVLQVRDPDCACDFARENAGKRFPAASAIPIPGPGCGRTDCVCIYRAESDIRKGARREAVERREEVRFEVKKIDRRKKSGRRVEDAWDRKRS